MFSVQTMSSGRSDREVGTIWVQLGRADHRVELQVTMTCRLSPEVGLQVPSVRLWRGSATLSALILEGLNRARGAHLPLIRPFKRWVLYRLYRVYYIYCYSLNLCVNGNNYSTEIRI